MREILVDPKNNQRTLVTQSEVDEIELELRWQFERNMVDPIFFDGVGHRTDAEIEQKQRQIDELQARYDIVVPRLLRTYFEISNES